MYYLDYAKRVGDRYILNFFADSEEDLKDVPTSTPYITRNGTNYGVPLETSVVTIIEKGVKVNYVLQNGEYIAGGDVAPVVGKLEATENKTYLAKDANLDGYSQVIVNVQPALQEKSVTPSKAQQVVAPGEGYYGLSQVTVAKIPDDYVIPTGTIDIITNGTHNVSGKASANVNIPATPTEEKTVDLAMASGDQIISPDAGKNLSKVTVTKPSTLVAGNIKTGVSIGGVTGTLEVKKEEEAKEVDLAMGSGDQTITPASGKVLSSVVVKKPATFAVENVKKGIDIGGVIGTLEPQKEEEAGTATITANGVQTFSPTSGKVFSKFTATVNVALPTLNAPTISLSGHTLTITNPASNGNFVTKFKVFSNGTALTEATIKGSATTVDLSTLFTAAGTYSITAKASAAAFNDSAESSAVSYTVYSVAITNSSSIDISVWDSKTHILGDIRGGLSKTFPCKTGTLIIYGNNSDSKKGTTNVTGGVTITSETDMPYEGNFAVTGDGTINISLTV